MHSAVVLLILLNLVAGILAHSSYEDNNDDYRYTTEKYEPENAKPDFGKDVNDCLEDLKPVVDRFTQYQQNCKEIEKASGEESGGTFYDCWTKLTKGDDEGSTTLNKCGKAINILDDNSKETVQRIVGAYGKL